MLQIDDCKCVVKKAQLKLFIFGGIGCHWRTSIDFNEPWLKRGIQKYVKSI